MTMTDQVPATRAAAAGTPVPDAFAGPVGRAFRQMLLSNEIIGQVLSEVGPDGLRLTGDGGFVSQLVKAVLERGLAAELGDHLGYDKGDDAIDADVRADLLHTLKHGVLAGLADTTSHGERPGEAKARALLEVFRDRQDDILRFVDDLTVPPTSNDAERGLRPPRRSSRRSPAGSPASPEPNRYRILGYLSTAAKHGLDRFKTLLDVFLGHVWIPDASVVT